MRRAGWYGWAILAVLAVLIPLGCQVSQAAPAAKPRVQVMLSPNACRQLTELVVSAATERDRGVTRDAFFIRLRRVIDPANSTAMQLVTRELRRVWTSGMPGYALELDVFTRCMTGPMDVGEEV